MKNTRTDIVFILDKSGSMRGLEKDTIGGFNSMLEKQKREEGEGTITTVLFDDRYTLLHDHSNIQTTQPLTHSDYYVEGSTALLDAMGRTINKIAKDQSGMGVEMKADKVLFVIITDGEENSSREFTADKIKWMIDHYQSEYRWEFIFLGANIDAVATARAYGINEDRAVNYHADAAGTQTSYEALGEAISELRCAESISGEWRKKIDADFIERES